MNFVAWATLALSAISATGVIVNSYFAFARHRREMHDAMVKEAARWSLEVDDQSRRAAESAGWTQLKLTRVVTDAPRVSLLRISLLRPTRATLAPMIFTPDSRDDGHGTTSRLATPDVTQKGRTVSFETEMKADTNLFFHPARFVEQPHSTRLFFAQMQPAFWRRSARLEIRLHAEEISSTRRSIRIIVKSQPIALTAKSAAKAR